MNMEAFPTNIYKCNIELQLRIIQLMQECRQRWLESAQQRNSEALAKTESELDVLSQATDLPSIVALRSETFGRLFQACISGTQTMNDTTLKDQAEFAAGLQQALQNWQKAVSDQLGNTYSTQWPQNLMPPAQIAAEPAKTKNRA